MQTDDLAVRVKPPGLPWQTLDAFPESVTLTANKWGPNEARMTIRRDPHIPWADLAAFTPLEIDVAGVTVWSGRIINTPGNDASQEVSISGQGWQYVLDDYPVVGLYVHTRLSDYKDARSFLGQQLAPVSDGFIAAGRVSNEGGILLTWPEGTTLPAGDVKVGVIFDFGDDLVDKVVMVNESSGNDGTNSYLTVEGHDTADGTAASKDANRIAVSSLAGSGTNAVTFTSPRRYVTVFIENQAGLRLLGSDVWQRITSLQAFGAVAWESGGLSILKAEDVIQAAVTAGAPVLGADYTQIASTTDDIPSFPGLASQTPRETLEAMNMIHNHVLRVGVDKRITFKARPTFPLFHVGAWSNYQFMDASMNDGSELYDGVLVTGTGPDEQPVSVASTQTVPVLALTGTSRRVEVSVEAPINTTIATKIASTFLDAHRTSSLHGTLTCQGQAAIRGNGSDQIHPSLLLRNAGEVIRLDDRIDPDGGGVGRNGVIVGVTYQHADRSVQVELDNERRDWDALLAKYNLLAGAVA